MSSARLVGALAVLLIGVHGVQAVAYSETNPRQKVSSAVIGGSGETLSSKKADESFLKADSPDWKRVNGKWVRTDAETKQEEHKASDPEPEWHRENGKWVRGPDHKKAEEKASPAPAKAESSSTPPAEKSATKVNLDVYYETRCPGCLLFINQTLEKLWRHPGVKDFVNITMYTYGNGMTIPIEDISPGYKFWHPDTTGKGWNNVQICQHGSDECLGNLVQVCTKDTSSHEKYMELIFCMAATTIQGFGEEKSTYECMQKNGIDTKKVKECVMSPHGNDLITETGKATHLLKGRLGTPWIMINGKSANSNEKILMNSTLLLQTVCSEVDDKAGPCKPFAAHHAAPAPAKSEQPQDTGDDFQVLPAWADKDTDLLKVSREHV